MMPLLSIVIANYNYGRFLEDAIRSVLEQDMGDRVELIICDAASTDNSVDIIKKYANGLPPNTPYEEWGTQGNPQFATRNSQLITWWCSEKDGGQSAAFNKGFSHARGRFLTWLNADDILLPGALRKFEKAVAENPQCEWFGAGVMWLDERLHIYKCHRSKPFSRLRAHVGLVSVWGPSSFFTKRILDQAGGVDERFQYTMDTDLWLKFANELKTEYRIFANYVFGLRLHKDAKMSAHMFEESGQASNANHPKWRQLAKERVLREKRFPTFKHTFVIRVLTMRPVYVMRERIDTWLYRGKHYKEFFER